MLMTWYCMAAWQKEDTSRVLLNRLADFCMLSVLQMRCDSPSQIHPWALSPFAARLLSMDQGTSNVSFPMKLEVHDLASGVLRVKGWERSGLQYFRSLWGLLVFFLNKVRELQFVRLRLSYDSSKEDNVLRLYLAWHVSCHICDEHSTYMAQLGKWGRDTECFCQNKVRLSQSVPLWAGWVFLLHLYRLYYTAFLWLVQVQEQDSSGHGLFPGLFSLCCSEFHKLLRKQISPSSVQQSRLRVSLQPSATLPCVVQCQVPYDTQNRFRRWKLVQSSDHSSLMCSSGSACLQGWARMLEGSAGRTKLLLNCRSQSWLKSEAERWHLFVGLLAACTSVPELLVFTSLALESFCYP